MQQNNIRLQAQSQERREKDLIILMRQRRSVINAAIKMLPHKSDNHHSRRIYEAEKL
jgi:hypothetical protein